MKTTRIGVLVSGGGTNLQALIDAEHRGELGCGKITLVIASKPGVFALERAEKNATVESIEKIASALGVSLSTLFERLDTKKDAEHNIPSKCYELLAAKSREDQERLLRILLEIDEYKKNR